MKTIDLTAVLQVNLGSPVTPRYSSPLVMVALWNRGDHYIFVVWFLLLSFFFLFFLA